MKPTENTISHDGGERRYSLRAVSRGIAMGKAAVLSEGRRRLTRSAVSSRSVSTEKARFKSALTGARRQLEQMVNANEEGAVHAHHGIFGAHLMMLSDPQFESLVCEMITSDKVSAEWAVKSVCEALSEPIRASADERMREKVLDFEDVAERLISALGGRRGHKVPTRSVVVTSNMTASVMAEVGANRIKGLVAEHGGWTSHGSILARELGIPAVTGLKDPRRSIRDGDFVIVDGFRGEILVNPDLKTRRRYRKLQAEGGLDDTPVRRTHGKVKTLDGEEIILRANADAPEGFKAVRRSGAMGVGLYRSEFLFKDETGFPTEAVQVRAYKSIAELGGKDGAKIRTFDLSVDRVAKALLGNERNPALGLRATRLMFQFKSEFRKQLRALLKASKGNRIEILVPMLTDISEIREVRRMLDNERKELLKKGIKVSMPRVGAMVEVPSAVLMADELAREADFLSIGTNDLVQYLVAVDRDNEAVADSYKSLHPAVLRALKTVLTAGARAGVQVTVCGEMASSPVYVAILIGLGARDLSMNPSAIDRIRYLVSGIAEEECRLIAERLLKCSTSEEAEREVCESFAKTWSSLFPTGSLPEAPAA